MGIPSNDTTYSEMSQSEATTGTSTTERVITAAVLNAAITAKIAPIAAFSGNTLVITTT